jgi:MFS superfamily sulfate permease-like transporter
MFKIFKKLYPKLKILTYIPGILVVVTFWLILSKTINLQKEGVDILGEVRSGFPKFTFPILNGMDYITTLLQPSIIIAIAGFVESIIVCKTYARK